MKSKSFIKLAIGSLITITLISINIDKIIAIFNNCNFAIASWQTVRRGHLDKVWDYEKVRISDGYALYRVGIKDDELVVLRQATPNTVTYYGPEKLNMDYTSQEDYDNYDGHSNFIKFIEEQRIQEDTFK